MCAVSSLQSASGGLRMHSARLLLHQLAEGEVEDPDARAGEDQAYEELQNAYGGIFKGQSRRGQRVSGLRKMPARSYNI